ncbi:5'-nucleotidase-like [Pseudomyrmex gracilis]|uniref:5'-nucleotidase-like n=1 Tax=Pseudomyrmex gracilis TaxID=219809 RepID=UPI000994BDC4|nr:5'-nucleotidase-like [Pseudomyrmex gracilis]
MRKLIGDLKHKMGKKTRMFLDGESKNCKRRNCNMGNLICDALIDYHVIKNLSENEWTDVAITVQYSGRLSITKAKIMIR